MMLTSIRFRSRPHKRAEVVSVIEELVSRMRTSHGCARSRLLGEVEDENAFAILGEWNSTGDAEDFLASRDFQILRGMRMLMQDEPVVVLDDIESRLTRLIQSR